MGQNPQGARLMTIEIKTPVRTPGGPQIRNLEGQTICGDDWLFMTIHVNVVNCACKE